MTATEELDGPQVALEDLKRCKKQAFTFGKHKGKSREHVVHNEIDWTVPQQLWNDFFAAQSTTVTAISDDFDTSLDDLEGQVLDNDDIDKANTVTAVVLTPALSTFIKWTIISRSLPESEA